MNNRGLGYQKLWGWFGLDRASWLTLPRVLMHEMPDKWQRQMANLLEDYDNAFPNKPYLGTIVQVTSRGKLVKCPKWLLEYRHPDLEAIRKLK